MTREELKKKLQNIKPPDQKAMDQASRRWKELTKPPGGLGKLEHWITRLAGVQGRVFPSIRKRTVFCFAADHGIVEEGVSPSRQEVSAQMVENILKGGAAVSVLAGQCECSLKVVDVGLAKPVNHPRLICRPVAPGTASFRRQKAMNPDQLYQAMGTGFTLAAREIRQGCRLLIPGEMGVGNSSCASAIYAAAAFLDPREVTGTGAGLDPDRVAHKARVIREALALHRVRADDPEQILCALGGFELGALCGVMLAGAVAGCAVVVDGFIAGAAAVTAMLFHPGVRNFLFFSHTSGEKGFDLICRRFDIHPLVDLNMRTGEGTGGLMILPLLDNALACYREMATFEKAGVTEIEETGGRGGLEL